MGSFYSCVPGRELTYWLTKCSDSVEMLGISRMDLSVCGKKSLSGQIFFAIYLISLYSGAVPEAGFDRIARI